MTGICPLSILFLAALPVFGSRIIPGNFDLLQDPNREPPSPTRHLDIYNRTKAIDSYPPQKDRISTEHVIPLTTSAPTLVGPNHALDVRSLPFRPEAVCSASNQDLICQVFFAVSSSVAAAASSRVSDSVLTSVSASFSASLLAASEGGFQNGLREASESAQSAIDAAEASASSMVSSILSALGGTTSPIMTTSSIVESTLSGVIGTSYVTASIPSVEVSRIYISNDVYVLTPRRGIPIERHTA
jgi:hypothetical protein